MNTPVDEFIPTRATLLSRLKDWDNHEGWQEFFDTYWRLIFSVALKAGLTQTEAEEAVQETVVSVARKMPGFEYDPSRSFKAWLLQITRRRIVEQLRKRPRWQQGSDPDNQGSSTSQLSRIPAPEPDLAPFWDEEWNKNAIEAAMQRVKSRVTPKQYQIFDLYVLKEWPIAQVKQTLNVSAARIYLAKHRVSRLVRDELLRIEKRSDWSMLKQLQSSRKASP